jgi:hypothetical protein
MACKVSGPFGGLLLSSFGRKEMSLTQCTHPDAPFYELDLIGLSFANAYGLDMPCQTMITVGATSLALIWGCLAALAVWGITKTIRNMRRN